MASKASQVLSNEDLLGGILEYALSPCPDCKRIYHPINSRCEKTVPPHCLLRVCQLWFPVAARWLWEEMNLRDVLRAFAMQRRPYELDSISEDGFARWKLYALFVRTLRLSATRSTIRETLLLLSEFVSLTLPEPLLPRLSSLLVGSSWPQSPDVHKIARRVATNSLETVKLEFPGISPETVYSIITCLQIFKSHSGRLGCLSISCVPSIIIGIPQAPGNIIYDFSAFKGLNFLKKLTIDPGLVSFGLLEVLGELPRLEDLLIFHGHDIYPLPEDIGPSPRSGAEIPIPFEAYYLRINHEYDTQNLSDVLLGNKGTDRVHRLHGGNEEISLGLLEFVGQTCGSLDTLKVEFRDCHKELLELDHLDVLKRCTEAVQIEILHLKGFNNIDNMALRGFTASWPNIQYLILESMRRFHVTLENPADIRNYVGPGLEFSCLSLFATELPNLVYLRLSLQAYDTSMFSDDDATSLPEFNSRCELSFPLTFLNFERPGFDADKAARYCANMYPIKLDDKIPAEGNVLPFVIQFNEETQAFRGLPKAWKRYFMDYDAFIASFAGKIEEHKAKRRAKLAQVG